MTLATIETRDFLSCNEAAETLGLSADTIRRYCWNREAGKTPYLEAMHVGRDWLIHKSEIARYKRERNGRGRPTK